MFKFVFTGGAPLLELGSAFAAPAMGTARARMQAAAEIAERRDINEFIVFLLTSFPALVSLAEQTEITSQ
jgi:hypothetical protein